MTKVGLIYAFGVETNSHTKLMFNLLPCPACCLACAIRELLIVSHIASKLRHPFRTKESAVLSTGKGRSDVTTSMNKLVYHQCNRQNRTIRPTL